MFNLGGAARSPGAAAGWGFPLPAPKFQVSAQSPAALGVPEALRSTAWAAPQAAHLGTRRAVGKPPSFGHAMGWRGQGTVPLVGLAISNHPPLLSSLPSFIISCKLVIETRNIHTEKGANLN